jgi:hypothetical protein
MLIKYNGVNIHALGRVETDTKKLKKNPMTGSPSDIAWLRPGWNEFPSAIWKMYEAHPDIVRMIDDKKIELMDVTVVTGKKKIKVGADDSELHLGMLEEKFAIKVVKETFNRAMLHRWMDEETRHKVKRELEKQIKPLMNEKKSATD